MTQSSLACLSSLIIVFTGHLKKVGSFITKKLLATKELTWAQNLEKGNAAITYYHRPQTNPRHREEETQNTNIHI